MWVLANVFKEIYYWAFHLFYLFETLIVSNTILHSSKGNFYKLTSEPIRNAQWCKYLKSTIGHNNVLYMLFAHPIPVVSETNSWVWIIQYFSIEWDHFWSTNIKSKNFAEIIFNRKTGLLKQWKHVKL